MYTLWDGRRGPPDMVSAVWLFWRRSRRRPSSGSGHSPANSLPGCPGLCKARYGCTDRQTGDRTPPARALAGGSVAGGWVGAIHLWCAHSRSVRLAEMLTGRYWVQATCLYSARSPVPQKSGCETSWSTGRPSKSTSGHSGAKGVRLASSPSMRTAHTGQSILPQARQSRLPSRPCPNSLLPSSSCTSTPAPSSSSRSRPSLTHQLPSTSRSRQILPCELTTRERERSSKHLEGLVSERARRLRGSTRR